MQYRQVIFDQCNDELIALLSLLPFESFEEKEIENKLIGYVLREECTESFYSDIETICSRYNVSYKELDVEDINWNATWESSFDPVIVDDFCTIKASFHDIAPDTKYTIVIDPKMAFGTGHHETTFMMIQAMEGMDFDDKQVLDYGCGTGVLAIMSELLGARAIDAIDIEKESYENTIENSKINHCHRIIPFCGTLELVEKNEYDIILANINRNVLLESSEHLYRMNKDNGKILLSGILNEDESRIISNYTNVGYNLLAKVNKGNWLAFIFEK